MFRYYSTRERDWEIIYAEEKNNTTSDKLPLLLLSSSSSSWHLAEDERECRNAIFRLLERVCISSVISRFPYSGQRLSQEDIQRVIGILKEYEFVPFLFSSQKNARFGETLFWNFNFVIQRTFIYLCMNSFRNNKTKNV